MNNPFTFNIHIEPNIGVLEVVATGSASPDNVLRMYDEVSRHVADETVPGVLLDARTLTLSYSPDKVIEITERLSELFRRLKLARLVNLSDYKHDLIETVASRHRLMIRSFTNKEEALSWLVEQDAA